MYLLRSLPARKSGLCAGPLHDCVKVDVDAAAPMSTMRRGTRAGIWVLGTGVVVGERVPVERPQFLY